VDEQIVALETRVRDLEAVLNQSNAELKAAFLLPPKLCDLLGLLLAVPVVTSEMVQNRLNITTDSKIMVWRLRQHMEPFGVSIRSKRSVGYWLDADTKMKIVNSMGSVQAPVTPPPRSEAA
jgi:hypothetical protein